MEPLPLQRGRKAEYKRPTQLTAGIRVSFFDAGHILGSASLYLELEDGGVRRSLVFSGDLGGGERPLLRAPVIPPHSDTVIVETTYGDRAHKGLEASVDELYQTIEETFRRGGEIFIPAFALERAQELPYFLRAGRDAGRLPRLMQVFLDSPMAISAREIFSRHPECYEPKVAALFREGLDPFYLSGLHFTRDVNDSVAINRFWAGAVILAGAGMCNGGRVRHHLKHNLARENCSVVFVGFAVKGTLARRIIEGARSVRIFDEDVRVRVRIHTINGFSAHAGCNDLPAWHRPMAPTKTFLVHGEEEAMRQFASHLENTQVEMPNRDQQFELAE